MNTEKYQILLENELSLITEELKTLGVQNPENSHDWVATPLGTEEGEADENVSADKAEELEERTALVADLETRFNDTTRALQKIKNGTYGMCEICNAVIEEDRLEANPSARTCKVHREEMPV
ncbi:hypothetical protein K2X96_02660 [Patescibacteria group bacterium]|nr:hypothetical protein [Patescibacteria group bacterium]